MSRRRILIAGWVLVLALSAMLPLSALLRGVVHFGPHTLHVHGTLSRPLISIGGSVVLPQGSRSVVVCVFCDLQVHGTAADDLVAFDGGVYLNDGSRVDGDVLSIAGGIYKAPTARAAGRLGGALHQWDGKRSSGRPSAGTLAFRNVRLGLAAGLALLLIGVCLIVVFPWQVVLIATTLRGEPLKSAAAGLTNLIIFVFLVAPLGLSVAGLPFALLLTGAAILAWLFGLTASAVLVGRLLSRGTVSLVWAAAAGLVVLACSLAVPLLGPLTIGAIGLCGTGALAVALLSRSRPAIPLG